MPGFRLKRVYEAPSKSDGLRVLVDRLWPRGLKKEEARIAQWMRDVAPSGALRKWAHAGPDRWDGFRERYFKELDAREDAVAELRALAHKKTVTPLFAAKDEARNNAVALKDYLERA
jgi:uncharacterized protein YeaO (DUF488 family)